MTPEALEKLVALFEAQFGVACMLDRKPYTFVLSTVFVDIDTASLIRHRLADQLTGCTTWIEITAEGMCVKVAGDIL